MVVRQGVWMVYGGVEWWLEVQTGCGKEWGVAGLDGGVAARGSKDDGGCGKEWEYRVG